MLPQSQGGSRGRRKKIFIECESVEDNPVNKTGLVLQPELVDHRGTAQTRFLKLSAKEVPGNGCTNPENKPAEDLSLYLTKDPWLSLMMTTQG